MNETNVKPMSTSTSSQAQSATAPLPLPISLGTTTSRTKTTTTSSSTRWRIVSAWTTLHRTLDKTTTTDTNSNNINTLECIRHSADGLHRRRVSLFLRRRRSGANENDDENDKNNSFRRIRSTGTRCGQLKCRQVGKGKDIEIEPVLRALTQRIDVSGGSSESSEDGVEYSNNNSSNNNNNNDRTKGNDETDIKSTERSFNNNNNDTKSNTNVSSTSDNTESTTIQQRIDHFEQLCSPSSSTGAFHPQQPQPQPQPQQVDNENENENRDDDDEIIGEICLENFAESTGDDTEDYAFIEGESLIDDASGNGSVQWVADEAEFAAFFASVGLENLLVMDSQSPKKNLNEFDVDDRTISEWRAAGNEHNSWCVSWVPPDEEDGDVDIRQLAKEFGEKLDECG